MALEGECCRPIKQDLHIKLGCQSYFLVVFRKLPFQGFLNEGYGRE